MWLLINIRTIDIAMPRTTAAGTTNKAVVLAVVHNKVDRRVSADHWARSTRSILSYLELADTSMEFLTVSSPNWGYLSETLLQLHLPSKKVLLRPGT
jgi:hypothetical protein